MIGENVICLFYIFEIDGDIKHINDFVLIQWIWIWTDFLIAQSIKIVVLILNLCSGNNAALNKKDIKVVTHVYWDTLKDEYYLYILPCMNHLIWRISH